MKVKETKTSIIKRLEAEGILRPRLKRGRMPAPKWKPVRIKGEPLSRTISEDREDRCVSERGIDATLRKVAGKGRLRKIFP